MAKKDAQLSIRISSDLLDQVRADAAAQERSIAYVVERIIRAHYEAEKPAKGRKG
jgi:hypothetical protein